MERSREQLKRIERLSRQSRHYRTHLNQISTNQLHQQLDQLEERRDQHLLRSYSRRQIEEERQNIVHLTVADIARNRQIPSATASEQKRRKENINVVVQSEIERDESRPSSSIQMPHQGRSCRLFSHDCQFYPCQPVYHYTSFVKKENDQCLIQRENTKENFPNESMKDWTSSRTHEKKYYQNRRQITLALHNQNYLVNRYASLQRTQTRLNEESQRLHERLAERKPFGRTKEHRHQLSQDIQRHLQITAKFCA